MMRSRTPEILETIAKTLGYISNSLCRIADDLAPCCKFCKNWRQETINKNWGYCNAMVRSVQINEGWTDPETHETFGCIHFTKKKK